MQMDLYGNVPEIVIDVHETTGKRINSVKHLMSMLDNEDVKYTVQKLPIGDVLGPGDIAIERKTVQDLVNTLKGSASGVPRLQKQMNALTRYEKPYLLIENVLSIRRNPVRGCIYIPFKTKQSKGKPFVVTMERVSYIHPSAFDALIESIREQGITILEGFDALHSAGLLYGILFPDESDKSKKKPLPVIRTRKGLDTITNEQEFLIAGFPSVNAVRARDLLMEFGSVYEVMTRTDEWTRVSGIGSKTVSSAKKVLFGKYEQEEETKKNDEEREE